MLHPLTKLMLLFHLVSTDIQYIHWKAAGDDFQKTHDLTENLYTYLFHAKDIVAEIAMELKLPVFNPNNWYKIIPEYETESAASYSDFLKTVTIIQQKLNLIIDALYITRKTVDDEDIKSRLDDFLRTLKFEANYKLDQTLSVTPKLPINFVVTGLDNRVSSY